MDKQYGESWLELDKIKRRLELKQRLKLEGVHKRYSPILQLQDVLFTDPAVDRYADLRKKGRLPGSPMHAKEFFGTIALIFVPMALLTYAVTNERRDYLDRSSRNEVPYEQIMGKSRT